MQTVTGKPEQTALYIPPSLGELPGHELLALIIDATIEARKRGLVE